jgi:hypothetical protein
MGTGEVGPICKLRRAAAIDKFSALIDQMFNYQDEHRRLVVRLFMCTMDLSREDILLFS